MTARGFRLAGQRAAVSVVVHRTIDRTLILELLLSVSDQMDYLRSKQSVVQTKMTQQSRFLGQQSSVVVLRLHWDPV